MEQANQGITQKLALPTKTKIAAWWMIALGVIGIIFCIYLIFMFMRTRHDYEQMAIFILLVVTFPTSLFLSSLGRLLFIKKKWAWWLLITVLFILTILPAREAFFEFVEFFELMYYFAEFTDWVSVVYVSLFFIPLVLLLLDRKNFFRIAS